MSFPKSVANGADHGSCQCIGAVWVCWERWSEVTLEPMCLENLALIALLRKTREKKRGKKKRNRIFLDIELN